MSQSFDLTMSLGESYIEGKATSKDKEYTVNIQGGETCFVLCDFREFLDAVPLSQLRPKLL
jgi:hypothetical protein